MSGGSSSVILGIELNKLLRIAYNHVISTRGQYSTRGERIVYSVGYLEARQVDVGVSRILELDEFARARAKHDLGYFQGMSGRTSASGSWEWSSGVISGRKFMMLLLLDLLLLSLI